MYTYCIIITIYRNVQKKKKKISPTSERAQDLTFEARSRTNRNLVYLSSAFSPLFSGLVIFVFRPVNGDFLDRELLGCHRTVSVYLCKYLYGALPGHNCKSQGLFWQKVFYRHDMDLEDDDGFDFDDLVTWKGHWCFTESGWLIFLWRKNALGFFFKPSTGPNQLR